MKSHITNEILDEVFFNDGSLRDIYVLDVDLNDWQMFFEWIYLSSWEIKLYKDGLETVNEIKSVAKLFKDKEFFSFLLSIDIDGAAKINCHFFSKDEMEFDVNPIEIKGLYEANAVFEFMRKLSSILGKEIFLTEENMPKHPLVTIKSDGTLFIHI
ncbi:MAG: hypothetical protein WAM41_10875 [Psychrobacillus psychrotolerans]|uniref:hypothetical protein n=1 Tax=Psychrobacillus psychrotolerans TaxID=126156 RepID=UPI003BAF795B